MMDIVRELECNCETLELHVLADLHIGDPLCDMKSVQKMVDDVQRKDNAYCIFNGDVLNWASKTSVSDVYGEALSPMEQIDAMITLMEPIKDKVIAVAGGNHEARAYKSEGIDISRLVCRFLGLEKVYTPASACIFLTLKDINNTNNKNNKITYSIFINHGSGGGRRDGAKLNRLMDMAAIHDAQIFVHSHTHVPAIVRKPFFKIDSKEGKSYLEDRLFINTAAQLDYGGYGDVMEFTPASKKTPIILLGVKESKYEAKV